MRTSKKLLSVLLTFIMTFSLIFGGLTTAFAATATDPPTSTEATDGYFNAAELTVGVSVYAPLGVSGAVYDDTIQLLVDEVPVTALDYILTSAEITAGTYSFTVNAADLGTDGAKAITTRIVDVATSTQGPESLPLNVTMDITAPAVTGVIEGGFYQTASPAFTEGTATLNSGAYTSGTAITGDSAQVLEVTDAAGNVTTVNFTTDNTAPAAPVVTNTGYINSTNQTAYDITGTGKADATVDVTVTDSVTAAVYASSVTVDTYGDFTATVATFTLAEGSISITATQTDAAGNVSSEATVGVTKDTTVPVIAMLGITPMNVAIGDAYTDAGATASDDVDGGITASIVTNGTVNTATLGIYTITYNVSDAAGNPATAVTKTVNVIPAAPSVTADDVNNVIVDADATMEYSIDTGVTWTLYDDTVATPTFPGVVTVEVRVAANAGTGTPAGASTTLTFTAVGDITGNNILLIGDYAFDLSGSAYDMNNFLIASQTAYSDPLDVTYHVYFRIGDAWYDIISDPDMLNQITDLTTINGDGLFNYMNMQ